MVFLQLAFLSMGEALLVIAIILLFFGATRIPVIARNLGKSVREFKDASKKGDKKEKDVKAFVDSVNGIRRMAKNADKTLDTMIKTEENWFFGNLLKLFK